MYWIHRFYTCWGVSGYVHPVHRSAERFFPTLRPLLSFAIRWRRDSNVAEASTCEHVPPVFPWAAEAPSLQVCGAQVSLSV